MSDRELLELAAKAYWGAEIDDICSIEWSMEDECIAYTHVDNQDHNGCDVAFLWNPLIDDGDALRLAVKLGMELTLPARRLEVSGASVWFDGKLIHHMHWMDEDAAESDFMDAARRNIVAVAADAGRAMP